MTYRDKVPAPLQLTTEQIATVARRLDVREYLVASVIDGIVDVLTGDPVGTIRRSPNGQVIAVRVDSTTHPYETFCPHGSASWLSDSVYTWPVIFTEVGVDA